MPKKRRVYVGDFETTVYEGQTDTAVWASALVEVGTEDVKIFHSIQETWAYIKKTRSSMTIYYHNLKFDGAFWLSYLMTEEDFKPAMIWHDKNHVDGEWMKPSHMPNRTFRVSIARMGQWYSMTLSFQGRIIEFRDSLKLMPFSVKAIGKAFETKHQKLDMEYEGFRYPGCVITDEERAYIANDVLVVAEALQVMFNDGHRKLTIGSCCMEEFKRGYGPYFEETFTPLEQDEDEWIRKAYKGGWCYVAKGKEGKQFRGGCTLDVNSLYPSVMHSMSGNEYPVGKPHWFSGEIPFWAFQEGFYFFVKIKTKFYLKPGMLPTIQIKGNPHYHGNEWLESSDVDWMGIRWEEPVELTLTCTDYAMLKEHYTLVDLRVIEGCWFYAKKGLFDTYIDKYAKIKMTSTGAKRAEAKLFLNNLYGKLATSADSTFKVPYLKEDGVIGFQIVKAADKKLVYIPAGAAVTSYARKFTIDAAQANYYGPENPGFIYADTDSIHCDLPVDEIRGVELHATDFCHWAHESSWDIGLFVRQKTYVEHAVEKDGKPCKPFYDVKCAGMPTRCKELFISSMTGVKPKNLKLSEKEKKFLEEKRTLDDFRIGLCVPGKLIPKQILGGVLLVSEDFTMKARNPYI